MAVVRRRFNNFGRSAGWAEWGCVTGRRGSTQHGQLVLGATPLQSEPTQSFFSKELLRWLRDLQRSNRCFPFRSGPTTTAYSIACFGIAAYYGRNRDRIGLLRAVSR